MPEKTIERRCENGHAFRGPPLLACPTCEVKRAYDKFDVLRLRSEPFDEGDMQNIHSWMREVTEWVERQGSQAQDEGG